MDQQVEQACVALDDFSLVVDSALIGIPETFLRQIGWTAPALTREDFSGVPSRLAKRIRETGLSFEEGGASMQRIG